MATNFRFKTDAFGKLNGASFIQQTEDAINEATTIAKDIIDLAKLKISEIDIRVGQAQTAASTATSAASSASGYSDSSRIWAEGTDAEVAGQGGTHSAKGWISIVNPNMPYITTVANSIANVNSVASNMSSITSVDANATNINAVAGNNANVTSVGANIAAVNAVNADLANINAVANDLTNIDAASANAALSKQWAIGEPTEPTGNSSKWWAQHFGLVYKGDYASTTTYSNHDYIRYKTGAYTRFYISIADNNLGHSVSDTAYWSEWFEVQTSFVQGLNFVEQVWTTSSAISAGSEITLPNSMAYTVGNNSLRLFSDGLTLLKGKNYEEVGSVGSQSNKVRILYDIPAGSDLMAWATEKNAGTSFVEQVWTTASAISSGSVVNLPNSMYYTVGNNNLFLYMDGLIMIRATNFEEVGTIGAQSNKVKLLCDVPAGAELMAWAVITS